MSELLRDYEFDENAPDGDPRNYSLVDLPDPYLFNDMSRAVDLVSEIIDKQGRIIIFGDYDADGLCSSAVLGRFLRNRGVDYSIMIPDRLTDGYGISERHVTECIAREADLLITVDCGITAIDEVAELRAAGINVIVTDHHRCSDELPAANCVINPQCPDERYPFKDLAGVGVAFNLVWALASRLGIRDFDLDCYLTLVALGTIADAMPVRSVNRILINAGLKVFREKAPLALRRLVEKLSSSEELDARFIAFSIAPRLNAAGRLADIKPALDLLFCEDEFEAKAIIEQLEKLNLNRRQIEGRMLSEANRLLADNPGISARDIIVLAGDDWHIGVIGIVAARLVDSLKKPVILLSKSEDGLMRASGRAPEGYNLHAIIARHAGLLEAFGGHEAACGFSVHERNFLKLDEELAEEKLELISSFEEEYFTELFSHDIRDETVELIESYGPFGHGHEELVFAIRNICLSNLRPLSAGRHLSCQICFDDGIKLNGIAFVRGDMIRLLQSQQPTAIYGSLVFNHFRGKRNLQFKILDILFSEDEEFLNRHIASEAAYEEGASLDELREKFGEGLVDLDPVLIKEFFIFIQQQLPYAEPVDLSRLRLLYYWFWQKDYDEFTHARLLELFADAGLLTVKFMEPGRFLIGLATEPEERVKLSETRAWQDFVRAGLINE
ncbi:MAG: single-stranded-DNA-specific exonuclease RecJ [Eubacteriales bacterium]|nr:single-stranded-DNA-specific exonuclease RecJ [Eubacteriales bacterium]